MPVLPSRPPSRFPLSKSLLHLSAEFVCALALSNAALPAAFCQTPSAPATAQKTPPTAVAPAAGRTLPTPATASHGKGAHEGIKVNGYWKIDVRNPDGSLDKHVEFENSLTTKEPYDDSGDYALSAILAGATMMGDPGIGVNISPGTNVFGINVTHGQIEFFLPNFSESGPCEGIGCILSTPSSLLYNDCLQGSSPQVYMAQNLETKKNVTISSKSCFNTLTVSTTTSVYQDFFAPAVGNALLQLQGSFTASTSGNVTSVASIVTFCQFSGSPSPAYCAVPSGTTPGSFSHSFFSYPVTFTSYTLPTPLPVGANQSVNISVSLTFN